MDNSQKQLFKEMWEVTRIDGLSKGCMLLFFVFLVSWIAMAWKHKEAIRGSFFITEWGISQAKIDSSQLNVYFGKTKRKKCY